jgi:hypothetical protein
MEDEEDAEDEAGEAGSIVPFQFFAQIGNGKNREDHESDDLLNGLELRGGKFIRADPVGGHLETVFEESDAPTGENDIPERFAAILEVALPREGHEDVGDGEQQDRAHFAWSILSRRGWDAGIWREDRA